MDADNPEMEIIHHGKRQQVVELAIGYLISGQRMDRCWLPGKLGGALHAVAMCCRLHLRWLMRTTRCLVLECFITTCVALANQLLLRKRPLLAWLREFCKGG
ncbi:MAG: hypothetical protein JNL77_07425 [Nitrosomonas sp.]|nr:hypothetical protein [Nitrosomonas sp.]